MAIKKLILLMTVLFLGFSFVCFANPANDEILGYINLSKNELAEKIGNNYQIVPTGPEETEEGYYYPQIGITIVFDETKKVDCIYCDGKVTIKGVKSGMNFEQVQKILGKTQIREFSDEESNSKIYEIWYFFGNDCKLIFMSDKNDGNNSSLSIYRIDVL
jgi:hypothetical protein